MRILKTNWLLPQNMREQKKKGEDNLIYFLNCQMHSGGFSFPNMFGLPSHLRQILIIKQRFAVFRHIKMKLGLFFLPSFSSFWPELFS